MKKTIFTAAMATAAIGAALALAAPAQAAPTIYWADLTGANGTDTVTGSIAAPSATVGVTLSGAYSTAQINNSGTNFWVDNYGSPAYNGAFNAPTSSDIVELSNAGAETITFSQAVSNVYVGMVSWNGASVTTSAPFTVAAEGCGYWGCGTFNATSTSFTGSGEAHGILEFDGPITSLTITDTVNEDWHGLNVGISDAAVSAAPEPASWALMFAGVGAMGMVLRRSRKTAGLGLGQAAA